MLPDRAFSLEARRGCGVQAWEEDKRGTLPVAQFKVRLPIRIWRRPLDLSESPVDCKHRREPSLKPFQVFAARGVESGHEVFPVVVRPTASVRAVDLVRDIAVAVEQATSQRKKERVRNGESAEGQALAWRQSNGYEPAVEPRVMELCEIGDASRARPLLVDPICAAQ